MRETGKLSDEILPFWLVFVGDITRDPKRNREIAYWFQGYEKNTQGFSVERCQGFVHFKIVCYLVFYL